MRCKSLPVFFPPSVARLDPLRTFAQLRAIRQTCPAQYLRSSIDCGNAKKFR